MLNFIFGVVGGILLVKYQHEILEFFKEEHKKINKTLKKWNGGFIMKKLITKLTIVFAALIGLFGLVSVSAKGRNY